MTASGVVLFDPAGTAHTANAIQGLVDAAGALPVHVVAQQRPIPPPGASMTWTERATPGLLPTSADRRHYRETLVEAMRATPEDHVFCDMGIGRTVRSRGPRIPATRRTVVIAHQSNAIDTTTGTRERRQRRVAGNRRVLRRLAQDGASFIAHTAAMRDRLADYAPADRIHVLGWPVVHADSPCLAPEHRPAPRDLTLLFPGSARPEKGLPLLLKSIQSVPGFDRLVIPGRIVVGTDASLDMSDPRIEWWDRYLDEDEYRATFDLAALVVLPYRRTYVNHGIFSSVLAETLAHGRPVVVSRSLGQLLPEGYRGAVVAEETEAGLAEALTEALHRIDELTDAAMSAGRAHAAAHHTFESYLAGILEAGSR